MKGKAKDSDKYDRIIADARRQSEARGHAYRDLALKLYPWVCGRCGREFDRQNLRELTVHHRDHNHDNNPEDGSNWELLCLYCHDNEHARYLDKITGEAARAPGRRAPISTHRPFTALENLLKDRKK